MQSALPLLLAALALAAPAYAQHDHEHAAAPASASPAGAQGTGQIKSVDAKAGAITLHHGPIAALNWPAMTMDLPVASGVDLTKVKPGQQVEFGLTKSGSDYTISSLKPKS